MRMHIRRSCLALLACWGCAAVAHAQSSTRESGWGFIGDLLYQLSDDTSFEGGSSISMNDDVGIGLGFGYRFNRHFELQFGLDWQSINYDADVKSDSGLEFSARGDLDMIAPHINATYNFLQGKLVPYVTGGIGWSWIDTNIPDAPAQTACWWDPWWGYYCGTFQSTRSIDDVLYSAGLGVRWDFSPGYSLRLGYEKRWIDVREATSTPGFDQFRLSFMMYEY